MLYVYGIKNCNTVKKGLEWLNSNNIDYEFFDVKRIDLSDSLVSEWIDNISQPYEPENLLNKSGMTWRKLDDNQKKSAGNLDGALALILEKPSVMKRPVIADGEKILTIGFNEIIFEEKFL